MAPSKKELTAQGAKLEGVVEQIVNLLQETYGNNTGQWVAALASASGIVIVGIDNRAAAYATLQEIIAAIIKEASK